MGLRGGPNTEQMHCSIDSHPYPVSVHVTHLFQTGDQCGDPHLEQDPRDDQASSAPSIQKS